ncbi:acyl-ACP desaturase [Streptomyces sp. NPDC087440]|uniref:acyl-ACP desaturase n=1 Tax=Streptomyces sp. NPDC087440 TaxID=3365790 RepID=UPI003814E151
MSSTPRNSDSLRTANWSGELEPVIAQLMDRHLEMSKEWFPHQYVPWGQGKDFDGPLDGTPWQDAQSQLTPIAQSAIVLSLLTEENLPTYHHQISQVSTTGSAWAEWTHRWTAEEDRHSTVLQSYVHATRAVDPVALERARMQHMSTPVEDVFPDQDPRRLAYVMVQELATRVSHRNVGKHCGEPVCERLFDRMSQDENLHMIFYRDLFTAMFDLFPDEAMEAFALTVRDFRMPGYSMPGFAAMSVKMASAGIYTPQIHLDSVVTPLMRALQVMDRTDLGPSGEEHRDQLAALLGRLESGAQRFTQREAERNDAHERARTE